MITKYLLYTLYLSYASRLSYRIQLVVVLMETPKTLPKLFKLDFNNFSKKTWPLKGFRLDGKL